MSFINCLTALLALAASSLAAPTSIQDLQISDLALLCSKASSNATLFDCKLEYTLTDPNASAKNFTASAQCSHEWEWDGKSTEQGDNNSFDTSYKLCYRSTGRAIQGSIAGFGGPDNVLLKVISSYMPDSSTYLSLFSDAQLAPLDVVSETETERAYADDSTQNFVVNGMTA